MVVVTTSTTTRLKQLRAAGSSCVDNNWHLLLLLLLVAIFHGSFIISRLQEWEYFSFICALARQRVSTLQLESGTIRSHKDANDDIATRESQWLSWSSVVLVDYHITNVSPKEITKARDTGKIVTKEYLAPFWQKGSRSSRVHYHCSLQQSVARPGSRYRASKMQAQAPEAVFLSQIANNNNGVICCCSKQSTLVVAIKRDHFAPL